ncbi:hypothetical protein ACSBR1_023872 [Camellia fascicularis]
MTDRVYPSSKPTANGTTTTAGVANLSFPATKAQLYNASRPAYRPQPPRHHRRQRSCCCSCCLWTTLIVFLILLLSAIAGTIFWVLYRPHRPTFSLSSLQIPQFNLTSSSSSSQLSSKFNLTINAHNPNKKLEFLYDPMSVSITADGVDVGDGSIPGFVHFRKNTTILRTTITSNGQSMDSTSVSVLKSDLKNKKSLPMKIELDTKVKVKIGGLKSNKVGIKVLCEGIKAAVPTGKKATLATTSNANCKVDLRIKIWKWTF